MAGFKTEFSSIASEIQALAAANQVTPNRKARRLKSDADPHLTIDNAISALRAINVSEPVIVRSIHHFSCAGGTMLAKCIASMANTIVLNEVDPLSDIPFRGELDQFKPTDIAALLHQSGSPPDPSLLAGLFSNSIKQVSEHLNSLGKTIVLRDHTHGHFLYGAGRDNQFTLKTILAEADVATISLVTVRHPARSYQSMVKAGWDAHLTPNTFEEYCNRYLSFLEAYSGTPIVRYEDFVADPEKVMQTICDLLDLQYFDGFQDVFDSFKFSGDSGRSSGVIEARPPSPIADDIKQQMNSSAYRDLVRNLGYQDPITGESET